MRSINEILEYSNNLTVLYAEDDKAIREHMLESLEDVFHKVIAAEDGEDGLAKYQAYFETEHRYPDIVITDIRMPKVDGIAMSRNILKLNPGQIIIVLSAHNESEQLLEIINLGINHFLLKPLHPKRLYETLYKVSKLLQEEHLNIKYAHELEMANIALNLTVAQLEKAVDELDKLAREDPLTGIANRRRFFEQVHKLFLTSKSDSTPFYLFVVDIDKFKEVNDTYGHMIGDKVITILTETVKNSLDDHDLFARFGGDEFVIVMTDISFESAYHKAELIRKNIARTHHILNTKIHFTISVGMAEVHSDDKTIDSVIRRADENLYKAKSLSRNTVRT